MQNFSEASYGLPILSFAEGPRNLVSEEYQEQAQTEESVNSQVRRSVFPRISQLRDQCVSKALAWNSNISLLSVLQNSVLAEHHTPEHTMEHDSNFHSVNSCEALLHSHVGGVLVVVEKHKFISPVHREAQNNSSQV